MRLFKGCLKDVCRRAFEVSEGENFHENEFLDFFNISYFLTSICNCEHSHGKILFIYYCMGVVWIVEEVRRKKCSPPQHHTLIKLGYPSTSFFLRPASGNFLIQFKKTLKLKFLSTFFISYCTVSRLFIILS